MKSKSLLLGLVFLSLISIWAKDTRPNIIFILADDHSSKAISAYGSKMNKTPNIDRIAEGGVLFKNSFGGTSLSGRSRASILSGQYSHRSEIYSSRNVLSPSLQTFPKILQDAGYQTAVVGKWRFYSRPKGFDHWAITTRENYYYNPSFYKHKQTVKYTGYVTDVVTDLGLDWLKNRSAKKPFLLMCYQMAPHRTWSPSLKYLKKYEDVKIPEPATLYDDLNGRTKLLKSTYMTLDKHLYYTYDLKVRQKVPFASKREAYFKDPERHRMTKEQKEDWDAVWEKRNKAFLAKPPKGRALLAWKYQRFIKNYLRCVDSVDENVGRILDYLEQEGLSENTIVIYSSDQGAFIGEHGFYGKGWMLDPSLRHPLLMRWPKELPSGLKVESLTQNVDIAPTLLGAANISVPRSMDGQSLLPLLDPAEDYSLRDYVYFRYDEGTEFNVPLQEGIRGKRYKLIYFLKTKEYNLFDLQEDPHELKDLARLKGNRLLFEKMKKNLVKTRQEQKLH